MNHDHIDPVFALVVAAVLWAIVLAPYVRAEIRKRKR